MRSIRTARYWPALIAAFASLAALAVPAAETPGTNPDPAHSEKVDSGKGDPDQESAFRFRFVGPKVGNRIAAVAGVAGDASVYYAGAASGGVWKSIDGGNRWQPVFDKESAAAIGSLAVAPSQPGTVWAGTGEAWTIRDSDVTGNGIYKSTDAGRTWKNMGLPEAGRIGRIIVHPTDPNIVFACVLGRTTGP